MLILLHGDNPEASRTELKRLKSEAKDKEVRQLDGRGLDPGNLTQALESSSLFGGATLVIIENLFSKLGKKTKLIEELAHKICSNSASTDVILWEDKEVGVTVIKSLGKAQVRLFKTPVLIFGFLDAIRPNNVKPLLELLPKVLVNEPPELLFAMIVRRVRQLIMLRGSVTPAGLQDWQASRLTTQAKSFNMDKLVSMQKQLLEIEYSIKTGATPFNLTQLTEQFLLGL